MKRIVFVFLFTALASCSKSDDEPNDNTISKRNLAGTWVATKLTSEFRGENSESIIGERYCYTLDSSELPLSGNCSGSAVEQCGILEEFSIVFRDAGVYNQRQVNLYENAEVDTDSNCDIIYHENDSFMNSAKGSWELDQDSSEISLVQTYDLIELVSNGEDYTTEKFDESNFIWKILSFSDSEMKIFWRTPDQADLEIFFKRE